MYLYAPREIAAAAFLSGGRRSVEFQWRIDVLEMTGQILWEIDISDMIKVFFSVHQEQNSKPVLGGGQRRWSTRIIFFDVTSNLIR